MQYLNTACGSCYGASDGCCNTCSDVIAAYNAAKLIFDKSEFVQCGKQKYSVEPLLF